MFKDITIAIALSLIISANICTTHNDPTSVLDDQGAVVKDPIPTSPIQQENKEPVEVPVTENLEEKPIEAGLQQPEEEKPLGNNVIEIKVEQLDTKNDHELKEPKIDVIKEPGLDVPQKTNDTGLLKSKATTIPNEGTTINNNNNNKRKKRSRPTKTCEDRKSPPSFLGLVVLWSIASLGILSIGATVFVVLKK